MDIKAAGQKGGTTERSGSAARRGCAPLSRPCRYRLADVRRVALALSGITIPQSKEKSPI